MYLAKNIKFLRRRNNWTQTEFGELIRTSKASVSSYEQNNNQPTIETLVKMAGLFKVSIDDLLLRDLSQDGGRYQTPPEAGRVEEPALNDLNRLMKLRINELEREIRRHNPDLADELGIS